MADKQLIGRATIKYNGKALLTEKGAKLTLGGVERKPIVGDQYHGYIEEAKEASLECTINVSKNTDLEEIHAITDGTVTFEADNGLMWVMRNAVSGKVPEVTGGDGGKVPVSFFGSKAVKM